MPTTRKRKPALAPHSPKSGADLRTEPVKATARQRLTDTRIRAIKPSSRQQVVVDGLGLELLVTPAGAKIWRLRWREHGKQQRKTIGRYPEIGIAAAREQASRLRARLWSGDPVSVATRPPSERESLDDAIDRYIAEHRPTWRSSTARTYVSAIRTFGRWASGARVSTVDQVTPATLAAYRAHAIALPRRAKAKGGSRRDVVSTGERRSSAAINCDLRAVKTMLQAMRRAGVLEISSDAIADNMRLLAVDRERPSPLRPAQLRALLDACARYDDDQHDQIAPLVLVLLLGGLRLGEALRLDWTDIDLDEGVIRVAAGKTHRERDVDLSVSPVLMQMFAGLMSWRAKGPVFGWTQATARDARDRLISDYGAPAFLWSTRHSRPGERSAPTLRSTCGCYLACAPAIFGGASVYRAAAQLGHSVQVAERHYLGALRRIPSDATALEAAMEIESEVGRLIRVEARLRVMPAE